MKNTVIHMRGVKKSFGTVSALQGVDLEVDQGEIFGLLGPSGAGKTTIIKLLTGQLEPDEGTAQLFGRESDKLSDADYTQFGIALDSGGLYQRLTVADNMKLFADIYGVDHRAIAEIIAQVGLTEAMKRPVSKLSKGMTQRLVLARAILHKPALLFLDEPTSGLDPATVQGIHELILNVRVNGCTIFLTTHNMEEAAKLCDNIVLLNEGQIVEQGAPEDLCRKYNKQQQIHLRLADGRTISLANSKSSAESLYTYFKNEKVEAIHSSEPTLENVFLQLTGRKLA